MSANELPIEQLLRYNCFAKEVRRLTSFYPAIQLLISPAGPMPAKTQPPDIEQPSMTYDFEQHARENTRYIEQQLADEIKDELTRNRPICITPPLLPDAQPEWMSYYKEKRRTKLSGGSYGAWHLIA